MPALIEALAQQDRRDDATFLLKRYVAIGPDESSQQLWRAWLEPNRDYLFFTDTGGFIWQLDPLAKKRSIPRAI